MRASDHRGAASPRGGPSGRRTGDRPASLSPEERLSRFLAYVLRHHPEEVGLALDERGAADVDALLAAARSRPGLTGTTRDGLLALVTDHAAHRFELTADGRIRARYGHSLAQPIRYDPADPPAQLFYGTDATAAEQALIVGLFPAGRQYVHLSVDTPAAREVGRRHVDPPAVLCVDTAGAGRAGIAFYRGGATVWLADAIPATCLTRIE